ncbi:hypothetical protein Q8A64_03345 [Oxalobacteraceae bacterium R-40]|uniref:Uncharacterized protein n=1 Tax=Keguizhuia sedimenti TaxID=3064264 RepID=A0ABU1BKD1_9BURK|nr:hypothetical protein [Oxalobacteraceae bacterium R-40]
MNKVGKHLESFETFIKKGIITQLGETLSDDEFGCLWSTLRIDDEELTNVNCGPLLANKILSCAARQELVELSFVRYNNGEKDFNSIAALKNDMGVTADVEFAAAQLRAGAAKMRRFGWIGVGIGSILIATLFIAVIGVAVLGLSIYILVRSKRPLRFAQTLEDASRALQP